MMRILIAYATKEGQTEKIARRLATVLRERGDAPHLLDTDHPDGSMDLEQFQAALVCAPIHAGGYPRSLVRFARQHRAFLERGPSAFLSVGLAIASRTTDGRAETLPTIEKFVKRTGWRPARIELVAGGLPYSKYNVLIRFIMRRIAAREGGDVDTSRDYEYTDWSAVDRFASQFAADSTQHSERVASD